MFLLGCKERKSSFNQGSISVLLHSVGLYVIFIINIICSHELTKLDKSLVRQYFWLVIFPEQNIKS